MLCLRLKVCTRFVSIGTIRYINVEQLTVFRSVHHIESNCRKKWILRHSKLTANDAGRREVECRVVSLWHGYCQKSSCLVLSEQTYRHEEEKKGHSRSNLHIPHNGGSFSPVSISHKIPAGSHIDSRPVLPTKVPSLWLVLQIAIQSARHVLFVAL